MRQAILDAVRSERIEDLRIAVELNELKPDFGAEPGEDPLAALKRLSGDDTGKAVLGVLGRLLETPPAVQPLGRDLENNRLYVWPALAEKSVQSWSEAEFTAAANLAAPDEVARMKNAGRYIGWRLVIAADGTWHAFKRHE